MKQINNNSRIIRTYNKNCCPQQELQLGKPAPLKEIGAQVNMQQNITVKTDGHGSELIN